MPSENSHPTDRDLLLTADGELPDRHATRVRAHLATCWNCRARMAQIEETIVNFARAYHQALDPQLPPIDGPRALLKAQLAQMTTQPLEKSWRRLLGFNEPIRVFAYVCATLFVAAILGKVAFQLVGPRFVHFGNGPAPSRFDHGVEPDRKLTPGVTRAVAIGEVCSLTHEEVVRDVPMPLRQVILREYGLADARANDYEIDYLIAPGLGGADDVRNLWPEPYQSTTWNARVKDDLEEHLHEMVCSGKLDLSTAQHDIATDWIAAYKKYFHTDRPLSLRSALIEYRIR
jgi:hypothetical protein